VLFAAFVRVLVIFRQKNIGAKAACKILVKLPSRASLITFFELNDFHLLYVKLQHLYEEKKLSDDKAK